MPIWTTKTIRAVRKSFQLALIFSESKAKHTDNWASSSSLLTHYWKNLSRQYFPENTQLDEYEITWSERKQKRVLGSCNLTRKRVLIARSMDRPELRWALEALIYHEMCHAVVGIRKGVNGKRNRIHGRDFYLQERRHPGIERLDQWIKSGGWRKAARSFSAHRAYTASTKKFSSRAT